MRKVKNKKSHFKKYDLLEGLKRIQKVENTCNSNKEKSFNFKIDVKATDPLTVLNAAENIDAGVKMEEYLDTLLTSHSLSSSDWMNLRKILNKVNTKDFNHNARVSAENILDGFAWERLCTKDDVLVNKTDVRFDIPIQIIRDTMIEKNDIIQVIITEREKFNNYIKDGVNDAKIHPIKMDDNIDRLIIMVCDGIDNPADITCGRTFYMAMKSKSSKTGVIFVKIYINPFTYELSPILFYTSLDKTATTIGKFVFTTYYDKNEYKGSPYIVFEPGFFNYDPCPKFSIITEDPYEISLIKYLYSVMDKFNKKHNQAISRFKNNDTNNFRSQLYIERANKLGQTRIVKLDSYVTEYRKKMGEYYGKGGTHASPVEHLRRGHYRHYKNGKKVFINPIIVNKGNGITLYLDDPEKTNT